MKKMMMSVMKIKTNRDMAFKKYVMPVKRLVQMNRSILFMVEILCLNLMPFKVPRCQNP